MNISEIIDPSRVAVNVRLSSKKAVLEKLANMLSSADPDLQTKEVFDALLARERLGTTGLGAGIAIPHGRVATGGASLGAFVRTTQAIDFDAVDNAPVDLFFALCVPQDATDEHLALLAALARKFSDEGFVRRLREMNADADVFASLVMQDANAA